MGDRKPRVAGAFYPGTAAELRRTVGDLVRRAGSVAKRPAVGCMAPHAGYVYSGDVAAAVYARISIPRTVVILGVNHGGYGTRIGVWAKGSWQTPLGSAKVDEDLAAEILKECPDAADDEESHEGEHSIEVQVPFLQFLAPEASIVPVSLRTHSMPALTALGEGIARAVKSAAGAGGILIVASSDMSHEPGPEVVKRNDGKAVARVLAMDPVGLMKTVESEGITMCGVGPACAMLVAAKRLGAAAAEQVGYHTSLEAGGTPDYVVGYSGVIVR